MSRVQEMILDEIRTERRRQNEKFGEDSYRMKSDDRCLAITLEELGEAAQALNDAHLAEESDFSPVVRTAHVQRHLRNMRKELIETAACCVAWVESIDDPSGVDIKVVRNSRISPGDEVYEVRKCRACVREESLFAYDGNTIVDDFGYCGDCAAGKVGVYR